MDCLKGGIQHASFYMGEMKHEKSDQLSPETTDPVIIALNELCRKTPEGYMITIEQRKFEGRENKTIIHDKDRVHMEKSFFSDLSQRSVPDNLRYQRINYS